jgi:pilus assembly protein CpaB
MIALAVALVISGGCTYLLAKRMDKHNALARGAQFHYVAAGRALVPGDVLRADDLEYVDWPMSVPLSGAMLKREDAVGRAVMYPLTKDEPITEHSLAAAGAGTGLAARIPEGMRATALKSDEVVGVAGFLLPGSHVDVLVTYRTDKFPEPITATVLQDAEVLAAGHQVQPDPEGKPATVNVVTLLLSPDDAQRAVLASTQGTIHFVLRNGADRAQMKEEPVGLSGLEQRDVKRAPDGPIHVVRHAARESAQVETVMGDKPSTARF